MEKDNYILEDLELNTLPERIKLDIENEDYTLSEIPDYNLDEEDMQVVRKRRDSFLEKVDDKLEMENERICKEIERKIDAEIRKELEAEFEPIKTLGDEDRQRAKELIDQEPLIQKAVNSDIVSLEEVVYFIDYYEIFSLINKTKRRTIDTLHEITSMFEVDNGIESIRNNIEKTLNINNSVLDVDFDYSKLKVDCSTFLTSSITKLPNKVLIDIKQKPEKKEMKAEPMTSRANDINKRTFTGSKGRFQSLPKIIRQTDNKLMNSVELFMDNKPVNLLGVRDNRREMIKPYFKSKHTNLFKLDTKKIVCENIKEELRKQFLEVLDIPKVFIEKDGNIEKGKKNLILRRIDDARNYFKTKM
jgi:hypothetical protein